MAALNSTSMHTALFSMSIVAGPTQRAVLAIGWIAFGLAACHGNSDATPSAESKPHANRDVKASYAPKAAEATVGMVEAVTLGAATVPVALRFDLRSRPTVGRPLELVIAVVPQIGAGPATVELKAGPGITLAADAHPIEIQSVEPAQVYRETIEITPNAEGVQLLGISVSLKHDEITETRAFSVPLIVARPSAGA